MEVHLTPETELWLKELSSESGRPTDELIEDAMAGYFREVSSVRIMLSRRYDEIKSRRVRPVDGETFLGELRRQEEERLKRSSQ